MPLDETTAIYSEELIGRTALIILGEAKVNSPAQARPEVHGVEQGIPRVICDFKDTRLADSAQNLIKTDGQHVKVIRLSKTVKPEKVRVVLDLEPNRSYDLQQVFFKEDNLFVIIVNTVQN